MELLVIEDDPDTSRMFAEVLADAGFDVQSCSPDALPERNGFSAVLTDIGVGNRSSELARQWVGLLRTRYAAPVIVVSGVVFADGDRTFAGLAADVLRKPIDIDDLVRSVDGVLAPHA